MTKYIARLLMALTLPVAHGVAAVLTWAGRNMEDEVGAKENAALAALDDALDAAQDWQEAEDETDATAINERVSRLNTMFPRAGAPSPGQPVDALTGLPVAPSSGTVGPSAPETSAPEDDAPVAESESPTSSS